MYAHTLYMYETLTQVPTNCPPWQTHIINQMIYGTVNHDVSDFVEIRENFRQLKEGW